MEKWGPKAFGQQRLLPTQSTPSTGILYWFRARFISQSATCQALIDMDSVISIMRGALVSLIFRFGLRLGTSDRAALTKCHAGSGRSCPYGNA